MNLFFILKCFNFFRIKYLFCWVDVVKRRGARWNVVDEFATTTL